MSDYSKMSAKDAEYLAGQDAEWQRQFGESINIQGYVTTEGDAGGKVPDYGVGNMYTSKNTIPPYVAAKPMVDTGVDEVEQPPIRMIAAPAKIDPVQQTPMSGAEWRSRIQDMESNITNLDRETYKPEALEGRREISSYMGKDQQLIAMREEDLLPGILNRVGDFVVQPQSGDPEKVSVKPQSRGSTSRNSPPERQPFPYNINGLKLDWKNVGMTGNCLFNSLIGAFRGENEESTEDLDGQYELRGNLIERIEGIDAIIEYYQSDYTENLFEHLRRHLYDELKDGIEKTLQVNLLQVGSILLGQEINSKRSILEANMMIKLLVNREIVNEAVYNLFGAATLEYGTDIQRLEAIELNIEALLQKYKEYMIQDTMYGTDLEIHLAARHYNRPIIVLRPAVGMILIFRNNPTIEGGLNIWKHTIGISDNPFLRILNLPEPLILGHILENQHYIYALYDPDKYLVLRSSTWAEEGQRAPGVAAGAGEAYVSAETPVVAESPPEPPQEDLTKLIKLIKGMELNVPSVEVLKTELIKTPEPTTAVMKLIQEGKLVGGSKRRRPKRRKTQKRTKKRKTSKKNKKTRKKKKRSTKRKRR